MTSKIALLRRWRQPQTARSRTSHDGPSNSPSTVIDFASPRMSILQNETRIADATSATTRQPCSGIPKKHRELCWPAMTLASPLVSFGLSRLPA